MRFCGKVYDFQARQAELMTLTHDLEDVLAEANIEGSRLRTDALKQQATFSGAALVGIAAVAETLLPEQQALGRPCGRPTGSCS